LNAVVFLGVLTSGVSRFAQAYDPMSVRPTTDIDFVRCLFYMINLESPRKEAV
jgi:hypothetical protein